MDQALMHSDCTFHIPNMRIRGRLCRTNQASNTAFRGFGAPESMIITNTLMDDAARALGMPSHVIQERNMYGEGSMTHFGQRINNNRLPACWQQVKEKSDYLTRRSEVDAFNSATRCVVLCTLSPWIAHRTPQQYLDFCSTPLNTCHSLDTIQIFLQGSCVCKCKCK